MAWTHRIQGTIPRGDNPLNLETTVKWTNDATGEILYTRPFGNDIDLGLMAHLRAIANSVLPARDAALDALKNLEGTTLDLSLTADEQAALDKAGAVQELQQKLGALRYRAALVELKVADETGKPYADALDAAKAALADAEDRTA
jgi:hypothetical protein